MRGVAYFIGLVGIWMWPSTPAVAQATPVPKGFQIVAQTQGVKVYRKDYPGALPDFVSVVDLTQATIRNLMGRVEGDRVHRQTMGQFWHDADSQNTASLKAAVVINGSFFSPEHNPTSLAFGLKSDGHLISLGYAIGHEYPNEERIFTLYGGKSAAILPYDAALFNQEASDIVGALDVRADKGPQRYTGRTFVGTRDGNGDGQAETVLLFCSQSARQTGAASVLAGFGANAQAMLDGGGSSFMIVNGQAAVSTTRTVPHAIAVYSGR